jgi:hypothetical protein
MPISLEHEREDVYRLDLSGTLHPGDFGGAQEALAGEIARTGPVRLLIVLREFDGWARGSGWQDMSFYISHGGRIDRIAIVGPARWRDEAMMFAAADLRRAPVQYFDEGAVEGARAWLTSSSHA